MFSGWVKAEYQLIYVTNFKIWYKGGASSRDNIGTVLYYMERNKLIFKTYLHIPTLVLTLIASKY